MAATSAAKNRALRQENLREWLSKKCTGQHLVDNLKKIEALDPTSDTFVNELNKYKVANDQRLKILDKYCSSLKSTEITGEGGEALTINLVNYANNDT